MKRLYSIILLVVFLVGTMQPIIPMIEYQLFEGDLLVLLSSEFQTDLSVQEGVAHCPISAFSCPACDDDEQKDLLDTDYYPLAVDISTVPGLIAVPQQRRIYLPVAVEVVSPTFLPFPPPPQLS